MHNIERLLTIMQRLRDPNGGCPWDRAQTYKTIVPHTLEEAYEVADAIEREDYDELRDELGDLLFQVVFYAQLAREEGRFDFDLIAGAIADKLERRHPHVFGDKQVAGVDEQTRHWEALKQAERANKPEREDHSVFAGIARTLPALSLAGKLQRRAAQVGFDWPDHTGVMAKVAEELDEIRQDWADPDRREDEVGDLLFTCVNLARHAGCDPEAALRRANQKFERRFRAMETLTQGQGRPIDQLNPDELEALWRQVK
ncbi:MAG: nucleoside triphosphate pyrophosphohydrolase [Gammaproteobacteria bacterium]|nr:nucleoside triphosphate pyrophosphohydrolase [Gammaproteobacteria bacterium]